MNVRHYKISEDDLAQLEDILPVLYWEGSDTDALNVRPDLRKGWQAVKVILSQVRWGYGPAENIETINPDEAP